MGLGHYKLVGTTPVEVKDVLEWARGYEVQDRRVALDQLGDVKISTVFLGLDHNWGDGDPLLFETMVFGGALDEECERYSTWEQAEAGHRAMVERVKASLSPAPRKGKID